MKVFVVSRKDSIPLCVFDSQKRAMEWIEAHDNPGDYWIDGFELNYSYGG